MPYVMAEGTPSQLGLLDWKGSMLTGTGNPTAKGWMNEGSIEISKEAKAVYLQNGIIPVCMYWFHMTAPYKRSLLQHIHLSNFHYM